MNTFTLLQALHDLLRDSFGGGNTPALQLPYRDRGQKKTKSLRTPLVFIGSLPPNSGEGAEVVPFVLVQALEGSESGDGLHVVQVAFRIAVQDDDQEAAENHLHNLLSLVHRAIMRAHDGGVLDGHFSMRPDEKGRYWRWQRPDDQNYPFAEAFALATWAMKGVE
jgi:hypothetical protein